MRKLLMAAVLLLVAQVAAGADYRYVKPDQFRQWLETGKKMVIVDIQVPDDFAKHHFKGSIETNAYPVKSDEDEERLETALPKINGSGDDVVIVCPRGGGGAKSAYEYLLSTGLDPKRLYILEKGMQGWPYPELVEAGK